MDLDPVKELRTLCTQSGYHLHCMDDLLIILELGTISGSYEHVICTEDEL